MILNQTNTHMVLLLSGITLRQHIMLTSAIEGKVYEARSLGVESPELSFFGEWHAAASPTNV